MARSQRPDEPDQDDRILIVFSQLEHYGRRARASIGGYIYIPLMLKRPEGASVATFLASHNISQKPCAEVASSGNLECMPMMAIGSTLSSSMLDGWVDQSGEEEHF